MSDTATRPIVARCQIAIVALIAAIVALPGCGERKPTGQTVAVVNGEGITISELNLELAGLPTMTAEQRKQVNIRVLQAMVERRVIAQQAAREGLDKNPSFVLQERRTREILLTQAFAQRIAAAGRRQTQESEVNSYLAAHPGIGENRRLIAVEQLRFAAPRSPADLAAFDPAMTLDALIAMLQARAIVFTRGRGNVDTAVTPPAVIAALDRAAPGQPVIVADGGVAVATVVLGSRAAPLASGRVEAIARQRIMSETIGTSLTQQRESLRRGAKISYAPGYAPPTAPAVARADP